MFFNLHNLSATAVATTPAPWEFNGQLPPLADKPAFREWCKRPSTEHLFYSAFEGLNASARISKENPPFKLHGIVADYDADIPLDTVPAILERNAVPELRPMWASGTFSGGVRLVWEFEEPVYCYNAGLIKELLGRIKKEFKLGKLLNGLDNEVLTKPDQYYEAGRQWTQVSSDRVPLETLQLWIYQAGTKVKWSGEGTEIPIEIVAAEVEKQFPGRWPGAFTLGARGPRFWDVAADNETAAIVRESGMQAFTGDKPFVSWSTIFGSAFTRSFEAARISEATGGVHFDGRHYWRQDDRGDWFAQPKDDIALHLRVKCGLSMDRGRMPSSEVDQALYHVQMKNRVVAAVPFVHHAPGIHREPDGLYLNTSNVSVCAPADGHPEWGAAFPWLSGFLDGYFSSPEQLDFFLAWLQRFYATAYAKDMQRGQSIFIAGPVNQGKTFMSTQIIGSMMGGATDVTSYMLGETSWNSSLFERAVWNIDDTGPGKDPRTHTVYSNNLKKHVANQSFDFQKKFKDSARVNWTGRTVVTLNDDEESLGMLPEWDISIKDKISLFRCADRRHPFPESPEATVHAELPFFCRWLLNWKPPEHTIGSARFGVAEYHEPSLVRAANERGKGHEFKEILTMFLEQHFTADSNAQIWEGMSTSLFAEMAYCDLTKELTRKITPRVVGIGLGKLASREGGITQRTLHGRTIWTIPRTFLLGVD